MFRYGSSQPSRLIYNFINKKSGISALFLLQFGLVDVLMRVLLMIKGYMLLLLWDLLEV